MYALHRVFCPGFYFAPLLAIPVITLSQMGLNKGPIPAIIPAVIIVRSSEFAFGESMQYLLTFVLRDEEPSN